MAVAVELDHTAQCYGPPVDSSSGMLAEKPQKRKTEATAAGLKVAPTQGAGFTRY